MKKRVAFTGVLEIVEGLADVTKSLGFGDDDSDALLEVITRIDRATKNGIPVADAFAQAIELNVVSLNDLVLLAALGRQAGIAILTAKRIGPAAMLLVSSALKGLAGGGDHDCKGCGREGCEDREEPFEE